MSLRSMLLQTGEFREDGHDLLLVFDGVVVPGLCAIMAASAVCAKIDKSLMSAVMRRMSEGTPPAAEKPINIDCGIGVRFRFNSAGDLTSITLSGVEEV